MTRATSEPGSLYFRPYLPPPSVFGGTLVLADSHHRGRQGGRSGWGAGFDALLGGDERNWTIAQITDCTAPGRTEQLYHLLKEVLHPDLTVTECFAQVAFANAYQGVLPEIGAPLSLGGVPASFRANLAAVKPDRVLVVAKRVWDALPAPDEARHISRPRDVRRYGGVWATWCYHPTGQFSRHRFRNDLPQLGRRWAAVLQGSHRNGEGEA